MISSLLTRAYIGVLWLYPAALRRQHGDEMVQCARLTLSHGAWRGARRLLVDTARSLPHEWLRVVRSGNPTPKRGESMRGLTRDVRYAVRLLWRSPGFTIAAALTLALGIGANTAIFSLADAALLRPIRVADPKALYSVNWSSAYPDYLAYAEHHDLFDGVIASTGTRVNAVVGGTAELVEAAFVSGNYFSVLGVAPALGRVLTSIDDQRNGPTVAVIGYRWWRTRLGGDPKAIGTTIRVNAVPVTIVGVAADGFRGTSVLERAQIFMPVTAAPRVQTGFFARPEMLDIRTMVWLSVIARLKPGVSPQTASAVLDATYRQFHPPEPGRPRDTIELTPLRALGRHDTSVYRFVGLLAMVVALTLLIGCSNLATLLLSRAAARRKEIGIRMAIGAGRGSIARQLLVESLLLSVTRGHGRTGGGRRGPANPGAVSAARGDRDRRARSGPELDRPRVHGADCARHWRAVWDGARLARLADRRASIAARRIARNQRKKQPAFHSRRDAGRAEPRAPDRNRAFPEEPRQRPARTARLQRRPGGDGSGESRGRPLFTCTREGLL